MMWHGDLAEAQPILADVLTNGVTSKGMAYGLEDDLDNNFNALTEMVRNLFLRYNIQMRQRIWEVLPSV